MRVKLCCIPGALKARYSRAQGGRAREAALKPWVPGWIEVLSPVRAGQTTVPPLQGFNFLLPPQGFGRAAAFALGFAAARFQRFLSDPRYLLCG